MLQLSNTVINNTMRTTPRFTWWITSQNLLFTSSMATKPNPEIENVKIRGSEKTTEKNSTLQFNQPNSLVSAAFERISKNHQDVIYEKIKAAKDFNQLLDLTTNSSLSIKNAFFIRKILFDWIVENKLNMSDIINDERYIKLCERIEGLSNKKKSESKIVVKDLVQSVKQKGEIQHMTIPQVIEVFKLLAAKQKRITPLLQEIAIKISTSDYDFNIKQLGDILYSITVLNFYDEALVQCTCKNLYALIPSTDRSAVIKSILNSLGLLRYRDEALINLLSTWFIENQNAIKSQDISSLLKTLAYLGYTPESFDLILKDIIKPLEESDMCLSSEWLDIVWSLCILNKASSKHYKSVLNMEYLNRLGKNLSYPMKFKILNINSAAQRLISNYDGPLLPENSSLFSTNIKRTRENITLVDYIIGALKMFLSSDPKFLKTSINTKMGFLMDAKFCVNKKCEPVPLDFKSEKSNSVFRIALITCSYPEFCRGKNEMIGPVKLNKYLLEKDGYRVLLVPYTEVKFEDTLEARMKYIKNKTESLVKISTS